MKHILRGVALAATILAYAPFALAQDAWCPKLANEGVISLPVNPAFLSVDRFDSPSGACAEGLTISSFFNIAVNPPGSTQPFRYLEGDQVLRIADVHGKAPADLGATDFERLTDENLPTEGLVPGGPPFPVPLTPGESWFLHGKTIWPNEAVRAPDGALPFEALTVAQGFHPAAKAGRLTILDLTNDAPDGTTPEYVVHQSTNEAPRFYHRVVFADMDGDGDQDIITVRSGFSLGLFSSMGGPQASPPSGELVWFEHPGNDADFATATWTEHVLFFSPFNGPDVNLDAADLDGDGIVEIVTTAFFESLPPPPNQSSVGNGRFMLFGVPAGAGSWRDVSAFGPMPPRQAVLAADQGAPFAVELVDLDGDGSLDVLATNHMPANDTYTSAVAGRVIAFEQPSGGDLFGTPWTVRVLMDDIRPRPNPAFPPPNFPGRLAPGHAHAFWPARQLIGRGEPWIVVSGDESGQVWLMAPRDPSDPDDWGYAIASVFDIGRYPALYPTGTQSPTAEGRTISTIGSSAIGYDAQGLAKIFVPVFEARDIHVLSLNPTRQGDAILCDGGAEGQDLSTLVRWLWTTALAR